MWSAMDMLVQAGVGAAVFCDSQVSAILATLRADTLAQSAHDVLWLDLSFHQFNEGVVQRILCVPDAGADESAGLAVQRLDLIMVQVISSLLGTPIGRGSAI